MPQQIKFYNKNEIDIDDTNTTITITDSTATNNGQDYVNFMRNRNNESAWLTTGSDDAANTQIDVDMSDARPIDRIILVGHNFKAFTIQYWNGASYVDFSTAINETTNSDFVTEFIFDEVETSAIRIIITGTQVADEQKILRQLIITKSIGQLEGWPQVKKPVYSIEKRAVKMLSGKSYISRQRGNFSCTLSVANYNIDADLDIIEAVYFAIRGVLVWINADDDTQFSRTHITYRKQDIFLMLPQDEWTPEHYKYYYRTGIKLDMNLIEVVQ